MATKKKHVVFFHPDLGIGGAERLVVDAAVGLQQRGHKVTIFTSHCDPKHCFDEARDGTLDVRVRGNTIIPPTVLTRFAILCAILRQFHLVVQITLSGELTKLHPDSFFIDQLSACIPLLRLFFPHTRILFYCHFPDKLLAKGREALVKKLYRVPFDVIESWSTGLSDGIVVNSGFTKGMFKEVFPSLRKREVGVVYPCVNIDDAEKGSSGSNYGALWNGKKVILSINRFEKKKDVGLAVRAFAGLNQKDRQGVRLVVAGGYDPRVAENVSYHSELVDLAEKLGLKSATTQSIVTALKVPDDIEVLFLLSVPAALKATLLNAARLLVYTPSNEHFGIVPLEAMLAGVPVLAANTGGPLETVVEGTTGWLRPVDVIEQWTAVMRQVLGGMSEGQLAAMGEAGKKLVRAEFSLDKMAERLDGEIDSIRAKPRQAGAGLEMFVVLALVLGWLVGVAAVMYLWLCSNS